MSDVSITEATGVPAAPDPAIDQTVAVIGCSETGALTALLYASTGRISSAYGAGPLTRRAQHLVAKTRQSVICARAATDTPGSYDTIDLSAFTGTAVPTPNASVVPNDEYQAYWIIVDGGNVGTDGITYYESRDNGRTLSGLKRLGTATKLEITDCDIEITLDPPQAGLVALAADVRTKSLAHFANAVAHNSADATAAAIIVAGAPTTQAQAITVLNQCRLAWISHLANDTAHDSIDLANAITAPAATSGQTAVTLANQLKAKINAHEAATYPADVDSLLVATATTVAIQSYDDSTLNAAGILQLDGYPNEITFTTAGGTPADAPATVDIAGFDETGAAQTETGLALSQIAGSVTSTKKWRGTGLSITYAAGDGPGATISIGTVASAHNSADVTNTVTAANAATGTMIAGDIIRQHTSAPAMSAATLAAAFVELGKLAKTAGLILIAGVVTPSLAPTISTGLDNLANRGKDAEVIIELRPPTDLESEEDWMANLRTEWENVSDRRISGCGGRYFCAFSNGVTAYQFEENFATMYTRRLVDIPRRESPVQTDYGALEDVVMVDSSGALVTHDEEEAPGLRDGRFVALKRLPNDAFRNGAYIDRPLVLRGAEDRSYQIQVGRVTDAIRRAVQLGALGLRGKNLAVIDDPNTPGAKILREDAVPIVTSVIAEAVRAAVYKGDPQKDDITDAKADDLVVVGQAVTVDGDDVDLDEVTVNYTPWKAIGRISVTLSIRI